MFFPESLENLAGALPKVAGALPKWWARCQKWRARCQKRWARCRFAPCDTASPRLPSQQAWRHWACSVQQLGLWERREQRACFSSCARWTG